MFSIICIIIILYYLLYLNGMNIDYNSNLDINYLKLKNKKDKLEYVYIKSNNNSNITILYFQGYLETIKINFGLNKVKYLNKDYNVISYNYSKNKNNILSESKNFIQFILSKNGLNINPNNLILFGKSYGCYLTLEINKYLYMNKIKIYKIILESPFYSLSLNKFSNNILEKITNIKNIKNILYNLQFINTDILILYGIHDVIINIKQIKDIINLLKKINKKKYLHYIISKNSGHNNILQNKNNKQKLKEFINK